MPIVLDPSRNFVEVKLFYVEETSSHCAPVYHFIDKKEDLENWKAKGYKHETEVIGPANAKKTDVPGMPVQNTTKLIYSISTKWKRMLWKDQNTIFSKCLRTRHNPEGVAQTELDSITYRDMKLKTCLKDWDLKDSAGNIVPVNNETIDMLTPEIANELINAFERYTEATADDLGESKG